MRFSQCSLIAFAVCIAIAGCSHNSATVLSSSSSAKQPAPDFDIKPGTYNMTWDPKLQCETGNRWPSGGFARVSKVKGLRVRGAASSRAYWAVASRFGILIDESKGTRTGYDVVYVFPNPPKSGLLNVKNAVRVPLKGRSDPGAYPNCTDIALVYTSFGKPGHTLKRPYAVELGIRCRKAATTGDWVPTSVELRAKGGWQTNIPGNGSDLVWLQAYDANDNGLLSDKPNKYDEGDVIILSRQKSSRDYIATLNQGTATALFHKLYTVKISDSGDTVDIRPYTGPVGRIKIKAVDGHGAPVKWENLDLYGAGCKLHYEYQYGTDQPAASGVYETSISIVPPYKDSKNDTNQMTVFFCSQPDLGSDKVTVSPNTVTEVVGGGPLSIALHTFCGPPVLGDTVTIKRSNDYGVSVGLRAQHSYIGGWAYSETSVWRSTMVFKDSTGKAIKTVKSKNNCIGEAFCRPFTDWKPGKYTVEISSDLGAYQSPIKATKTLVIE